MSTSEREQAPLPLVAAIIPPLTFHALTILTEPPWPCIDSTPCGYAMLSISLSLPMLVLAVPDAKGTLRRLTAIAIVSIAAPLLCLHAGLSAGIVVLSFMKEPIPASFLKFGARPASISARTMVGSRPWPVTQKKPTPRQASPI